MPETNDPILENLSALCSDSLREVSSMLEGMRQHIKDQVSTDGRVNAALLEQQQFAAHGLSWFTTYFEGLSCLVKWYDRAVLDGNSSKLDELTLQIGFAEYLAQIYTGIPMSQGEIIRPESLGFTGIYSGATEPLIRNGNSDAARKALVAEIIKQAGALTYGVDGLDEEYAMIRDQFRKFVENRIAPHAHQWHLNDELIPDEIIAELGELGVFGLTIPEEFGGFGMSKTAMCVVTEELARG